MVVYPQEDKSHFEALEKIIKSDNYQYAMIEHNFDKEENGKPKKSHIHLILKFDNARSIESVAVEVGVHINYIQKANFVAYTQYLIHKNDKDKYQYNEKDIYTNIPAEVENALKYKGDYGRADTSFIIDIIYKLKIKNLRELVWWAKENRISKRNNEKRVFIQ